MTMTEVWNVIYLWQGERHLAGQHEYRAAALAQATAMRDENGFICWVEFVGYRERTP